MRIYREGSNICVEVPTALAHPGGGTTRFVMRCECERDYYADAVIRHIQTIVSEGMRTARRTSYDNGWKDAKAKRSRCDWFSGELP